MYSVKATLAAAVIVCAACGTSGSSDAGADASCSGSKPTCCASCLNDVLKPAVCSGGTWSCPAGSVSEADCVGKCSTGTGLNFCTYLPKPECASCANGTTTKKVCNEDAGELECPAGTYEIAVDASSCPVDASAD
jgi:hypothetical protein